MTIDRPTAVRATRDALWVGLLPAAWLVLAPWWGALGTDSAHAYWHAWQQDLYGPGPGSPDAYSYSPLFAQVLRPLTLLPWPVFLAVWSLVLGAALWWLLRPLDGAWRWLALGYTVPAAVAIGNIEPLLAVAAVVGMQRPAAWAFPLLTKVTPGLGPVWFAVRGEWRRCALALGATLALVAASAVLDPSLWERWVAFLADSSGTTRVRYLPLPLRLVLAVLLVAWAARSGRRWLVPVAMVFAMPLWSSGVLLLLAAVPRLRRGPGDVEGPGAGGLRRSPGRRLGGRTPAAVS